MTATERDAEIGGVARTYEQLLTKRACLRKRLARHASSLTDVAQLLLGWASSASTATKDVPEFLEEAGMDAVRQDVRTMMEVEKALVEAERDMRDVGLANLIRTDRTVGSHG